MVVNGSAAKVECAVREDETSPASELLTELRSHRWPDPEADELPDAGQVGLYSRLLAAIEDVADGYDPPRGALNFLEDGIWEFRITNLRLTFYDTDGRGNGETHCPHPDSTWVIGRMEYELPDDFASTGLVRLGHNFAKQTQQTPQYDLELAADVRREDLAHDRLDF